MEIIAKMGGTSVAQPELVRQHMEHDPPGVLVVSAPGLDVEHGCNAKVTDMLLDIDTVGIGAVRRRYEALAERMYGPGQPYEIRQQLVDMTTDVQDWRARDWPVAALGECWSARMFANYLGRICVDARDVIRFDNDGTLNVPASEALCRERFDPAGQYVVGGFFGADWNGNVRLLGRGGSDVTPAIIARALNSREYHNYSDVDGFMTADPRHDPSARLIPHMSYGRVIALADKGCQLLHARVAHLLGHTAVATIMRNAFGPAGNRGTVITGSMETA